MKYFNMNVFYNIENLENDFEGAVVTLGVYDGLHRAHMEIINRVIDSARKMNAKSLMITFDSHPRNVLNNTSKRVKSLTCPQEKIEILESTGLDGVLVLKVTGNLLNISAEDFVKTYLVNHLHVRKVIVGYDYHFGKDRGGRADQLVRYGDKYGFDVEIVNQIYFHQHAIRSSVIRTMLSEGDVVKAAELLGRYYRVEGRVVHGSGRGKTLGFPTANIEPDNREKMLPVDGIYLTECFYRNTRSFGICNIGIRKTFNESERVIEVYLIDIRDIDLYGHKFRIGFLERLRDEVKFETREELIAQMKNDLIECKERIKKYN
ncbi:MAG: hypothetical protein DRP96_04195 [Candidatus Neomarinimicrobiota bacterium]|nr:MAG: hypothetical protein DRP96_04195 [Candidatus Neomarinimicrobiota bacterium]